MKRGYQVFGRDSSWNVPVVAHTTKEAKKIAWNKWSWELDCEWIDLRVHWRRGALVDDLEFGCVDNEMIALECKLIDYLWH
jgi:hypothetical protein